MEAGGGSNEAVTALEGKLPACVRLVGQDIFLEDDEGSFLQGFVPSGWMIVFFFLNPENDRQICSSAVPSAGGTAELNGLTQKPRIEPFCP